MSIFKLPDLGEGLPDAEIREWYVNEGDHIEADQPMVAMETAKALVDVPAPQSGTVIKLYGAAGDIITTGAPLMAFESSESGQSSSADATACAPSQTAPSSAATVAGVITQGDSILEESATGIARSNTRHSGQRIIPAVRALARKLGVDIHTLTGTGPDGLITAADVQQATPASAASSATPPEQSHSSASSDEPQPAQPPSGGTPKPLRGVRRSMAAAMAQSHREVVPVVIVDDADLQAWQGKQDITARVIRAIVRACKTEPALNAHFDAQAQTCMHFEAVNLGLALDSEAGLFVPVIEQADQQTPEQLRATINRFKAEVADRSIDPSELQGSTLMLSNFGSLAGRYANPIIVPPITAIIGTGRLRDAVVPGPDGQPAVHRILPLSLSFDHRAITGGEAARFLAAMMQDLSLAE